MRHYGLSACTLRSGLRKRSLRHRTNPRHLCVHTNLVCLFCDAGYVNEEISGTFIERLLVETLPDVVMLIGLY